MHDNLQFWQQVKNEYIEKKDSSYLCGCDTFKKMFESEESEKEIFAAANSFLNEKKTIPFYANVFIGTAFLFAISFYVPNAHEMRRKIRLDFLDYMIEKCKK